VIAHIVLLQPRGDLTDTIALILEFDEVDALKRYLTAPAHDALGHLFFTATSAALAYDYEFD
jgi:hypothetical protein